MKFLDKPPTHMNRVVSQVKKIVNELRSKTKTTFQQWTTTKKPLNRHDTNTTMKPMINKNFIQEGHSVNLKTNKRRKLHYYGALNKRFVENSIMDPPEVIDN